MPLSRCAGTSSVQTVPLVRPERFANSYPGVNSTWLSSEQVCLSPQTPQRLNFSGRKKIIPIAKPLVSHATSADIVRVSHLKVVSGKAVSRVRATLSLGNP